MHLNNPQNHQPKHKAKTVVFVVLKSPFVIEGALKLNVMDCKCYDKCEKEFACRILGECVFGHLMIVEARNPAAYLNIHYSKRVGGIVGAFRKIKRGKDFNGEYEAAKEHAAKIGLPINELLDQQY